MMPIGVRAVAVLLILSACPAYGQPTPAAEAIRGALESDRWRSLEIDGERVQAADAVAKFYENRDFEPVWSVDSARLQQLLETLRTAASQGLRRTDYHYEWLSRHAGISSHQALDAGQAAELDLLASDAFLLFALHLGRGKVREEHIAGWNIDRPDLDLPGRLERAASGDVASSLDGLLPSHPGYELLRQALLRYRAIAERGDWARIAAGKTLRKGDRGARVESLCNRLIASGDLRSPASVVFNAEVEDAVRTFQGRCGLAADGAVGPKTRRELNIPVSQRVRRIKINLERWRWLPNDLGSRYVLVNIAGYQAGLYDDDRLTLGMRAIVGKPYRRTPIFSDTIRYVVFNPYWNIPSSIAEREIWPKGAAYMARHDIEVVEGRRLRQRPGPENALGRVKFMFPNRFNVYLHDTPARELFSLPSRSFSHGCIRLEKPIDLAAALLAGQGWSRERIVAATEAGRESTVHLDKPVPVHILLWPAWVTEDGVLQFRPDVYGRDAAVGRALDLAPPSRD